MKDLWNEICYQMKRCRDLNVSEKEYENEFVKVCLLNLGWMESKGDIARQYQVQSGTETKLADIVLKKGETEEIVIEMKRPFHAFDDKDEAQLFSYMRLLPHQVRFGISVGRDITIYYDDPTNDDRAIKVQTIPLEQDNENGVTLLKLLENKSYTFNPTLTLSNRISLVLSVSNF